MRRRQSQCLKLRHSEIIMLICRGGVTVVKIFLTPHIWLTWGDMKQDIAVFFTAIMTSDLD